MHEQHTFAIGDIHGRADLLEALLEAIDKRAAGMGISYRIVFLGDVIDRGPRSRDAMDIVANTLDQVSGSHLILGNHDWFPIRILDELAGDKQHMALTYWIYNLCGGATLLSYGFDPDDFTVEDLKTKFPARHLDLLRSAVRYVELPHHILVHAGLAPGIPLAEQSRHDLMWIREPFLLSTVSFGKTVIHGHSVTANGQCEIAANRIGIDTGAYLTGRLSAVQIHPDGQLEFLQTDPQKPGDVMIVTAQRI
ncbi:metallophosphoesterase [Shinella sp.]|uniref:metallophosphoesterase n=1 Tax=Shinella sp. TaxID=1870904 RepID=UPI0025847F24|nr:metallophosphoesterase [Shinella sp.]MCW5711564.1 serine/threonine protein phosphatase [Shinella sp.]